jgi:hypothetical protein
MLLIKPLPAKLRSSNFMVSTNSSSALHNTDILERSLPPNGSYVSLPYSQSDILESPQKLVVIDPSVENHRTLMKQTQVNTKVFLLAPNADGIEQITQILCRHSEIVSLHVLASGTLNHFRLGNTKLDLDTLDRHAWDLQDWCSSFSATGSGKIVLYGCKFVAESNGFAFVHRFSQLTGVDVIASST